MREQPSSIQRSQCRVDERGERARAKERLPSGWSCRCRRLLKLAFTRNYLEDWHRVRAKTFEKKAQTKKKERLINLYNTIIPHDLYRTHRGSNNTTICLVHILRVIFRPTVSGLSYSPALQQKWYFTRINASPRVLTEFIRQSFCNNVCSSSRCVRSPRLSAVNALESETELARL